MSDFLSESRIASVNDWIVSSPFRSESRVSGIRLEDVLSSPEFLEKSRQSNQDLSASEATSKRLSDKVHSKSDIQTPDHWKRLVN